jgi:hypothetical protein
MKIILSCLIIALSILPNVAWGVELPQMDQVTLNFAKKINSAEDLYYVSLQKFSNGRITLADFTQNSKNALEKLYAILFNEELHDQDLRDRSFDIILRILKRFERDNILTDEIQDQFLNLVESQLIPKDLLKRSRGSLVAYFNTLVDINIRNMKLEMALRVIHDIKMLNAKAPISQQQLKAAYNRQLFIAGKYIHAPKEPQAGEVAKDLPKATKLILEIINTDSPAETGTVKRALDDLFEITFEILHKDPSEQELDNINGILDDIVHGSLKSTREYKEKAQLHQIDLAIYYSSPAINNKDKAREILENINASDTSPKNRKSARDLLKKL